MNRPVLDLSQCEREPIHAPGAVQPHAAFLAVDPATGAICAASQSFLDLAGEGSDSLIGTSAAALFEGPGTARLAAVLAGGSQAWPLTVRLTTGHALNALFHRADGLLMLDLEPVSEAEVERVDAAMLDSDMLLHALRDVSDDEALQQTMVDAVAGVTGFDRVMLYDFDGEWNGTVVAESRKPAARDSFLGLKFPSSDIPAQARALFLHNRVRQIVDVEAEPSPILPNRHPVHGGPLDLSLSQVRAVSPVHLDYLRNMGVRASLVIALTRGQRLSGLLACHHYSGPLGISTRMRGLCGLLCEALSSQLAQHQQRIHTRQVAAIAARLEPFGARAAAVARASQGNGFQTFIASVAPTLLDLTGAESLWLAVGDETVRLGDAPPPERVAALVCAGQGLAQEETNQLVAVDSLAPLGLKPERTSAGFAYLAANSEHGSVLAMRGEHRTTETWAGDPEKRVVVSGDGTRLHPRSSFDAWRADRRNRCTPWSDADRSAIRMIAERLPHWRLAFEQARRDGLIVSLEASRAETRRLALVAERANDSVIITDAEGFTVWANAAFFKLSGYPPEEILGKRPGDVLQGPLSDPAEVARMGAAIAKAEPVRVTLVNYTKQGEPYWVELEITPITDEKGRVEQFIAVERDVTEARERARALEEARRSAEEANSAKSNFLATMSHEIRTPMNGVIGMADLLHARLKDPELRRMVEVIRSSGAALLTVLNDVLDFSKIEAGRLELEVVPFAPTDLLRQVASLHGLRAQEKGIRLDVAVEPDCEAPRRGDPHRLLQIMHNLVSNALKFSDRGTVSVRFGCGPDDGVAITVADEGCGMTEAQAARVFEPFAQADAGTARKHGGTGLGLAIVSRLVAAMDGTLDMRTAPGAGTTLTLTLPLPRASGLPANRAALPRAVPPGLSVVAADDNEINRTVLGALLAALGVEARIAETGEEAIALVEAAAPDLLLLDITMPGKDGVETLRAIRALERAKGRCPAPAIAVTAHAMSHQIETYLAQGFTTHAAKPLDLGTLAAALSEAVAAREDTRTMAH